ncbi:hypothetical protein GCM10020331_040490 [Ectobacillus funiculus]
MLVEETAFDISKPWKISIRIPKGAAANKRNCHFGNVCKKRKKDENGCPKIGRAGAIS